MSVHDARRKSIQRPALRLIFAMAYLGLSSGPTRAGSVEFPVIAASEIAEQHCGGCHGARGQSQNPTFPKLAGQNFDYLVRQIKNFQSGIRRGTIMSAQLKSISEPEILNLAAYFSKQGLNASPPQNDAPSKAGQKIYAEGVAEIGIAPCASCHGPQAQGKLHVPRLAGQHVEYLAEQLNRFNDDHLPPGQSGRHPPPIDLTDDEIQSVSDYLASLE